MEQQAGTLPDLWAWRPITGRGPRRSGGAPGACEGNTDTQEGMQVFGTAISRHLGGIQVCGQRPRHPGWGALTGGWGSRCPWRCPKYPGRSPGVPGGTREFGKQIRVSGEGSQESGKGPQVSVGISGVWEGDLGVRGRDPGVWEGVPGVRGGLSRAEGPWVGPRGLTGGAEEEEEAKGRHGVGRCRVTAGSAAL